LNKGTFIFVFLVGVLLFSNLISAEMLTSLANVSYDSDILNNFENQSEVRVFILLKENITSNYSNYVETKIPSFLSEKEFKLRYIFESVHSISAEITKLGFDKLVNNSDIKEIVLVEKTYLSNNESNIYSNEAEEKSKFDGSLIFLVGFIIFLIVLIFLVIKKQIKSW
jgi:hypothetical protein